MFRGLEGMTVFITTRQAARLLGLKDSQELDEAEVPKYMEPVQLGGKPGYVLKGLYLMALLEKTEHVLESLESADTGIARVAILPLDSILPTESASGERTLELANASGFQNHYLSGVLPKIIERTMGHSGAKSLEITTHNYARNSKFDGLRIIIGAHPFVDERENATYPDQIMGVPLPKLGTGDSATFVAPKHASPNSRYVITEGSTIVIEYFIRERVFAIYPDLIGEGGVDQLQTLAAILKRLAGIYAGEHHSVDTDHLMSALARYPELERKRLGDEIEVVTTEAETLRSQLAAVNRRVGMLRAHRAGISSRVDQLKERLLEEIGLLQAHKYAVDVGSFGGTVYINTPPMYCQVPGTDKVLDIGKCRVEIDLTKDPENAYAVTVHNLTREINSMCHPHIDNDGEICLDEWSSMIVAPLTRGELSTVFDHIIRFIQICNPRDAGAAIDDWPLRQKEEEE